MNAKDRAELLDYVARLERELKVTVPADLEVVGEAKPVVLPHAA